MINKPWLFLPVSWTSSLSPLALKIYSRIKSSKPCYWNSLRWRHLNFSNPLGTAGGIDKNAFHIEDWWSLGAGFLEVGTVTPEPQKANSGKILDRSLKHFSIWNNMGFPNKGLDFVKKKLSCLPEKRPSPVFVNIGKNRQTPVSQAFEDYKKSLSALNPYADAFVINISSPNTKDLRTIFDENKLPRFLKSLKGLMENLNSKIPLILKISPDETDFIRIVDQSLEAGIDGWCICNSTKKRSIPSLFPEQGGISGKLLASQSLNLLKELNKYLSDRKIESKLVISCGGVFTAQDVLERLQEGANLVQVYSALVFEGPSFFQSVYKTVSRLKKESKMSL